ncbi:hypothetical protein NDU88_010101 [Pleurodeles waltl]|uniref:Secreted protein n=1 Tax=Pleurodeles waltl TaxID=8319 RepID=A0AAV7RZN9_PLEWA|nr:hypothetical protein NDU88_010101 [Pleurodeles waltl]
MADYRSRFPLLVSVTLMPSAHCYAPLASAAPRPPLSSPPQAAGRVFIRFPLRLRVLGGEAGSAPRILCQLPHSVIGDTAINNPS